MAVQKPMPRLVSVDGQIYQLTVLLVHTRHKDGVPALVKVLKEDSPMEMQGEEGFMVVYALHAEMNPG